ncbi:hypothetical protein [Flavobacterium panici]|uniref:Uncharacterized protein n=1 Tax=Flavobacterium panici TaxID=2654843 RepID=A0A9N8J371_9FLAO|nr:hypothetical protein [Flavobacterium panici]CAC9974579.1 hypothetical protein FLAPXU55_02276 [Flavobacterium panici]
MVIKRIIYVVPVLSIVNSLYLFVVYLEAFMLNKLDKKLISNFTLILFSTLLVMSAVTVIVNIAKKEKNRNLNFVDFLLQKILLPIFCLFFMLFIYDSLKFDYFELLKYGIAILIEIFSIAFAIGKNRENALLKLIGVVFVWVIIATICFSLTGFFDQYLGYKELGNSNSRLVFTAIFYHLFNACFLFYSLLPKSFF